MLSECPVRCLQTSSPNGRNMPNKHKRWSLHIRKAELQGFRGKRNVPYGHKRYVLPIYRLWGIRKIWHGMNQNSGYMIYVVYEVSKCKSKGLKKNTSFWPCNVPKMCPMGIKGTRCTSTDYEESENMTWYESKQQLYEMWCLRSDQV